MNSQKLQETPELAAEFEDENGKKRKLLSYLRRYLYIIN